MIRSIWLENFKSWKQIRNMRLAPITGLFGANSSGKSSILQWLLMLKQTVESSDPAQVLYFGNDRSYVDLGTFKDVVHGHDEKAGISWTIAWTSNTPIFTRDIGNFEPYPWSFSCRIQEESGGSLKVHSFDYTGGDMRVSFKPNANPSAVDNATSHQPESASPPSIKAMDGLYRPYKFYGLPGNYKATDVPVDRRGLTMPIVAATSGYQFESLFSRIFYLGPLREPPQRTYLWGGSVPTDVGRRGERVIDALIASRLPDQMPIPVVEQATAKWLCDLRLIDSFELTLIKEGSNLYEVKVRKTPGSPLVSLTEVGFGVSQILPVIVLCYYVPKGSTIILEQPELHLHPSVQSDLANVFIDAIKNRGVQIILESHSEHLLRRLQRRIAEEKLSNDDVALYFCEYEENQSHLKPLTVDPYGNIANWPRDFFGDEMGEIAAMSLAAVERRSREGEQ